MANSVISPRCYLSIEVWNKLMPTTAKYLIIYLPTWIVLLFVCFCVICVNEKLVWSRLIFLLYTHSYKCSAVVTLASTLDLVKALKGYHRHHPPTMQEYMYSIMYSIIMVVTAYEGYDLLMKEKAITNNGWRRLHFWRLSRLFQYVYIEAARSRERSYY